MVGTRNASDYESWGEEEVSGLTSGRITGCPGSSNNKLDLSPEGGSRVGREVGWAESLLHGRDSGKPPAVSARGRRGQNTESLPSLHSTRSPRPWASPKESGSRNHEAPSLRVWRGRWGRTFPGYWDIEGSSSFRTPPTRCRLPVTSTWMAAASRRMPAPLLAVGWLRRLLGGL